MFRGGYSGPGGEFEGFCLSRTFQFSTKDKYMQMHLENTCERARGRPGGGLGPGWRQGTAGAWGRDAPSVGLQELPGGGANMPIPSRAPATPDRDEAGSPTGPQVTSTGEILRSLQKHFGRREGGEEGRQEAREDMDVALGHL